MYCLLKQFGKEENINMNCPTKKKCHDTEKEALNALIHARAIYQANTAVNVYCCRDCDLWHLTSKGEMHPELKKALTNGTIDKIKKEIDWGKHY